MGDVEFGLSKGNFGCRILIEGTDNEFDVTWREVLCGGKIGIQVLKEGNSFRNVW
eukprot:CAMPEP_0197828184 /NCGR_PEP_ID=MMETSP1437-20131217/4821_1 /TAXON_ID=49252 ORGANISM="Eucampia antarctica, Strain CCMP1452" /NCGR_SAMPLE_ID=MMETSP1437 /ASSEMBLY_ACC=CAM_ASM_001096 /LENGTH=54 /DNA_ID=CAMNT_0043429329 /DNA_START=83 /DNA_END=244 /DNA_ORIENTATION=-